MEGNKNQVHVEGFTKLFEEVVKHLGKDIYVLFTGSAGADGKSWCPDCVVADPVVHKYVEKMMSDDAVFISCGVGDRTYWKDKDNDFRTHDKLKLKGVPTLLKWDSPKRLVEAECAKEDLVSMFFEED